MSILATFIGIDKHADLQIRDLTGARRDAPRPTEPRYSAAAPLLRRIHHIP